MTKSAHDGKQPAETCAGTSHAYNIGASVAPVLEAVHSNASRSSDCITMLVRTEIGFCALALHAICTQAVTTFGSACFDALNTTHSAGGKATCALGLASVTLNATNLNLILPPLTNQFVVTEIIQEVFQVNSTILENSTKGTNTITGPYDISVVLCYPSDINATSSVKTVQVLAHGLGLDKTYWDIAPGYSYVDAAAEAGYATLAFDRLGVGASDHPDPVNVVQSTTHVEVLHGLIQGLKSGSIGGHRFEKVACVAHSYGSVIQTGHDVKYPRDCDAVIVTGISNTFTYVPSALLSNDPTIANTVSNKFAGLDNGYLITPTAVAFQESFFRYPYFDTASM